MASISKEPNGRRRILFVAPDGKRKTIRLGKVSQRTAEGIKRRVEQLLEALHYKHPVEGELAQWVADLELRMAKRLAAVGLIAKPETKITATLGPFLQTWLAGRKGDYKPASLISWGQVIDALTGFLGADCPLVDVTPAKGEAFRQSMLAAGLRPTTIHKRLQHARMFFTHAKRQCLVERILLSLSAIGPATHQSGGLTSLRTTCNGSLNTPPMALGSCLSPCPGLPACAFRAKP